MNSGPVVLFSSISMPDVGELRLDQLERGLVRAEVVQPAEHEVQLLAVLLADAVAALGPAGFVEQAGGLVGVGRDQLGHGDEAGRRLRQDAGGDGEVVGQHGVAHVGGVDRRGDRLADADVVERGVVLHRR